MIPKSLLFVRLLNKPQDDHLNPDPSRFLGPGCEPLSPGAGGNRVGGRDDRVDLPPIADAGDWRRVVAGGETFRGSRSRNRLGHDRNVSR